MSIAKKRGGSEGSRLKHEAHLPHSSPASAAPHSTRAPKGAIPDGRWESNASGVRLGKQGRIRSVQGQCGLLLP